MARYVIVTYEDEYFPGLVTEIVVSDVKVGYFTILKVIPDIIFIACINLFSIFPYYCSLKD